MNESQTLPPTAPRSIPKPSPALFPSRPAAPAPAVSTGQAVFTPSVSEGTAGETVVWLPQLAVFAQGRDLAAAKDALAAEAVAYCAHWRRDLATLAMHQDKTSAVQAIEAARALGGLKAVVAAIFD